MPDRRTVFRTLRRQHDPHAPVRVMFIHGFASHFDPSSETCRALAAAFELCGESYDYTLPFKRLEAFLAVRMGRWQPDILVGTSLGGFWAAWLGSRSRRPFLALNPMRHPTQPLRARPGQDIESHSVAFGQAEDTAHDYPDFPADGLGHVLIETADTLIDPSYFDAVDTAIPVTRFAGGTHRFSRSAILTDQVRRLVAPVLEAPHER